MKWAEPINSSFKDDWKQVVYYTIPHEFQNHWGDLIPGIMYMTQDIHLIQHLYGYDLPPGSYMWMLCVDRTSFWWDHDDRRDEVVELTFLLEDGQIHVDQLEGHYQVGYYDSREISPWLEEVAA